MTTEADIRTAISAASTISALQPVKAAIKEHVGLDATQKGQLLGTLAEREDEIGDSYRYRTERQAANRKRGIY